MSWWDEEVTNRSSKQYARKLEAAKKTASMDFFSSILDFIISDCQPAYYWSKYPCYRIDGLTTNENTHSESTPSLLNHCHLRLVKPWANYDIANSQVWMRIQSQEDDSVWWVLTRNPVCSLTSRTRQACFEVWQTVVADWLPPQFTEPGLKSVALGAYERSRRVVPGWFLPIKCQMLLELCKGLTWW